MTAKVLFMTQESAYPQMGVLYLVDALRQAGIESELVSSGISQEALELVVKHFEPQIIGMSVMTAPEVADFERHSIFIKKAFPKIKTVWGGVHSTLLANDCLKSNYIDYVFVGQGEDIFPSLVEDIVNGRSRFSRKVTGYSPSKLNDYQPSWGHTDVSQYLFSETHSVRSPDVRIARILAKANEEVELVTGHAGVEVLDYNPTKILLSQIKKWDVGLYDLKRRIFYYLLTSRGCPYRCTFCSEPLQIMHGNAKGKFLWNAHDLDWVKSQITQLRADLAKRGEQLEGIGIWDDMFWNNRGEDTRAIEILEYLKKENLGYLIEARADQLLRNDCSLFRFLGETGCIQVFVGAESASQETLNYIRKGTKVRDYYRLIEIANEIHVSLRMSFIVGFPHETDESVNATLDFCDAVENGEHGPWVNISGPKIFTPYPGTVEYERAVEAGFLPPPSHVEWGRIHRATEDYLEQFPWFLKNYSDRTLERLEKYFGSGYQTLSQH